MSDPISDAAVAAEGSGGTGGGVEGHRRISSEIVSLGAQMKQAGSVQKSLAKVADDELKELEEQEGESALESGNCFDCLHKCLGIKTETKNRLDGLKKELEIDWHTKKIEDLKAEYGTIFDVSRDKNDPEKFTVEQKSIKGLPDQLVSELQAQWGPNMLTPPATKAEWVKFCEQLTGFFSLLLWSGGILCFVGYGLQGAQDNLYLGIVLFVVVFLTGLFGYIQEKKSSDLMDSFKSMMPKSTQVWRNGNTMEINAQEIVPGDILEVKYGCNVPADMRVIFTIGTVLVDNASLTGEAEPQKRSTETTDDNPLETKNLAFFGTSVVKGTAIGICVATGDHTVMGRIAALASGTENQDSPIAKEIHHFVMIVSAVAFVLGVTFFSVGMAMGTDIITNLVFMIGIIVANVPEGLLATVTVCMALTSYRMATNNVLVKNLEGVETLGSTSCICSDKTGTLTQNDMTVDAVCVDGKRYQAMCGKNSEDPELKKCGSFERLLRVATLCNNVHWDEGSQYPKKKNPKYNAKGTKEERGQPPRVPDKDAPKVEFMQMVATKVSKDGDVIMIPKYNWRPISDATECALAKFAQNINDIAEKKTEWPIIAQVAFNSKNKYQIGIYHNPITKSDGSVKPSDTILIAMKGATERVINRCDNIWINGKLEPFTQKHQDDVETCQASCSADGLRVLGFADYEMTGADYKAYCGTDQKGEMSPLGYKWDLDKNNFPTGAAAGPKVNPKATQKLNFCGLFCMIDPERPQVPGAVAKCKTAGIRVIMVTGDHPMTAQAIAKKCGIIWGDADRGGAEHGPSTSAEYTAFNKLHGLSEKNPGPKDIPLIDKKTGKPVFGAVTRGGTATQEQIIMKSVMYFDPRLAPAVVIPGWELAGNEDNEPFWEDILAHTQIVFARTSPQQKLVIVEHCQKSGEIVAVTGDGVNDAPALKKADIGVAMGIMGSDVSKEAADMILLDDNFASIVAGVEEGRLIFDNLKKSIAYTLSSNIPEIAPFIMFILIFLPLPLSTVLILCIDLGTDMVPAISMAWENKEADIMLRPPRDAGRDRLVTKKLVFFSYLQIGVIQAIACFYTWFVVMYDYGYPAHILPGLGRFDAWGKQLLWCKPKSDSVKFRGYNDDISITYADIKADIVAGKTSGDLMKYFPFFDGRGDDVEKCTYAPRNFQGLSSIDGVTREQVWGWQGDYAREQAVTPGGNIFPSGSVNKVLEAAGYVPYIPFSAVRSPFFRGNWMKMPFKNSGPMGQLVNARGFGDAKDVIVDFFQPGGVYKLKAAKHGGTAECEGTLDSCCGYLNTDGDFVQTVPMRDQDAESKSSEDKSTSVEDIFDDETCEVTYVCEANIVTAKCSDYDKKFTSDHYYANFEADAAANSCASQTKTKAQWEVVAPGISGADDGLELEVFPTWDAVCKNRMDGSTCGGDNLYCANIASRNSMFEALTHAQCAYFVAIVIVQWADLIICKTRMNSIYHQGMLNPAMNYGLIFETLLAAVLCYTPGLTVALGTRPLKFLHWMPGIPYSIFIFSYDEVRKLLMRKAVVIRPDKQTGQVIRIPGWLERNTYY